MQAMPSQQTLFNQFSILTWLCAMHVISQHLRNITYSMLRHHKQHRIVAHQSLYHPVR